MMGKTAFFATLLGASGSGPCWALHGENDFGPVGVVRGQTVRVNVVNTAVSVHHTCPVVLSFHDDAGKQLLESNLQVLGPGQGAHLDLNADGLELKPGERAQIRAHVSLSVARGYACRHVIATEEVFDNATGETRVLNAQLTERFVP
ncbi:MAG TPA: hypothetical protein VNL74_09520 [Methylococcus sp.]|nr:hypothetical protein [Methylococcus sp.]